MARRFFLLRLPMLLLVVLSLVFDRVASFSVVAATGRVSTTTTTYRRQHQHHDHHTPFRNHAVTATAGRTFSKPLLVRGGGGGASSSWALNAAAAAPAAASSVMMLALPSLPTIALSCLLPTSLGYFKYEYGVSYGYGLSVASVAWLVLRQLAGATTTTAAAYWHAAALVFYGVRLCLFLFYRERCIPRFRDMRERIEERRGGKQQTKSGDNEDDETAIPTKTKNRFLARTPFVVGCSALYACMAAPLFVTAAVSVSAGSSSSSSTAAAALSVCVALTWAGFVLAALGDFQKSIIKAIKGQDALVKGGVYALLRHPNYTGEAFGWTASFLASVVAAVPNWKSSFIGPLVASFFGWVGIVGVLAMAATGLEKRQKEKYATDSEYVEWTRRSWAGPTLPGKK